MLNTRRNFLKKTALLTPMFLPSHLVLGANKPSERITLGLIGMGKQAGILLGSFLNNKDVQIVAVCDVDKTRRESGTQKINDYYKKNPARGTADCKAYNDFQEVIARDDIDAVLITTPDHWHVYPAIEAMNAGKDVYCEKPLTHNIHESIEIMKVAKQTNRILQTGSMQRSMPGFRTACELVQNGVIGKISHVHCQFGNPGIPCDLPEEKMEPGLDWNMWLGPAPVRPYHSTLSPRGVHKHYPNWRNFKEFGGGSVCDWGAHHLDIAQWGLGMDDSGPVVALPPQDANTKNGSVLKYANGITVKHVQKGYGGVEFFGDQGKVRVTRGEFELILGDKMVAGYRWEKGKKSTLKAQIKFAEKEYLQNAKVKLYESSNHVINFIECVKARKKPITDAVVGARSAICCHLMNQTYYNHQKIDWDPDKLAFKPGTGNPAWLTKEYRSPWKI